MKAKILKKGRKRFKWYFTKSKTIVLLDLHKEKMMILDENFLINFWKQDEQWVKNAPCGVEELAFRTLKTLMFGRYGWSISKFKYRLALKFEKKYADKGLKGRRLLFDQKTNEK